MGGQQTADIIALPSWSYQKYVNFGCHGLPRLEKPQSLLESAIAPETVGTFGSDHRCFLQPMVRLTDEAAARTRRFTG